MQKMMSCHQTTKLSTEFADPIKHAQSEKLLSLCLWHIFSTNQQTMRQNGVKLLRVLEALYKQVAVESIDSFGL